MSLRKAAMIRVSTFQMSFTNNSVSRRESHKARVTLEATRDVSSLSTTAALTIYCTLSITPAEVTLAAQVGRINERGAVLAARQGALKGEGGQRGLDVESVSSRDGEVGTVSNAARGIRIVCLAAIAAQVAVCVTEAPRCLSEGVAAEGLGSRAPSTTAFAGIFRRVGSGCIQASVGVACFRLGQRRALHATGLSVLDDFPLTSVSAGDQVEVIAEGCTSASASGPLRPL